MTLTDKKIESPFKNDQPDDAEYVFIQCPGMTLYDKDRNAVKGVKFDKISPEKFEIVGRQIFAPNHTMWRKVKKEDVGKICRCEACQDATIRLIRGEGADTFIPSSKHPNRKSLQPLPAFA